MTAIVGGGNECGISIMPHNKASIQVTTVVDTREGFRIEQNIYCVGISITFIDYSRLPERHC